MINANQTINQGQQDACEASANQPRNSCHHPGLFNQHAKLSNETLYVQSKIMNIDEIQSMLMNQILNDDKQMMRMVDRAKLEDE